MLKPADVILKTGFRLDENPVYMTPWIELSIKPEETQRISYWHAGNQAIVIVLGQEDLDGFQQTALAAGVGTVDEGDGSEAEGLLLAEGLVTLDGHLVEHGRSSFDDQFSGPAPAFLAE